MVEQYFMHWDIRFSKESVDTEIQRVVFSSTMSYDKVRTVAKVLSLVNERTTSSFITTLEQIRPSSTLGESSHVLIPSDRSA